MLATGKKAPTFNLTDAEGKTHKLSDYKGKKVVLYFYPKDNTSGCTQQACDFRDSFSDLKRSGTIVLGISPDSASSHQKFAAKFKLPFPLLVDGDHKVAQAYGAWGEKSLYGRKFQGINRSTFLIDGAGQLQGVWPNVKVNGHVAEVMSSLQGGTKPAKAVAAKAAPKAVAKPATKVPAKAPAKVSMVKKGKAVKAVQTAKTAKVQRALSPAGKAKAAEVQRHVTLSVKAKTQARKNTTTAPANTGKTKVVAKTKKISAR